MHRPLYAFMGGVLLTLLIMLMSSRGWSIPPNTPIANTAMATYEIAGLSHQVSDTEIVITDAGSGNSPPSGVQLSPASANENTDGVVIGGLSAIDSDPGDTHTYTTTDPRFEIIGDQLKLRAGETFDFETEPLVSVEITVTDADSASHITTLIITVLDLNETPTDIVLDDSIVPAALPGGVVGTITTLDPDVSDTHTYSFNDPRFEVVNGSLKLQDGDTMSDGESVSLEITVTDSGGLTYVETIVITGSGASTPSQIRLLQYAPGVGSGVNVAAAQCEVGGVFGAIPAVTHVDGTGIGLPGSVALLGAASYKSGEVLFFEVVDRDADADPLGSDLIDVVITSDTGDREVVRLAETGVTTGVFVGYLQTRSGPVAVGDCLLDSSVNTVLTATYTDPRDVSDISATSALVDPFGLAFDTTSGRPVDDVQVTLINAGTGAEAVVFGDDGLAIHPSSMLTGGSVVDSDGALYQQDPGSYRFPFVAAGSYLLQVTPPRRFVFPTSMSDAVIQTLPGAPYDLGPGSRGQTFAVPVGPAFRVDIPLDLLPVTPTDALISAHEYTPGSAPAPVSSTMCFDGSGYLPAGNAVTREGSVISLPGAVAVTQASRFSSGDPIFVMVDDNDQNLDAFAPDTLDVNITIPGQPDMELIRLTETGNSTGVFAGFIQTAIGTTAVVNDCRLNAQAGSVVLISYQDPLDSSDLAETSVVIDPFSMVFSSVSGNPIDGARITLINVATNLPADGLVFADDGTTSFPATLTSGATVTDGAGNTHVFAPGSYRFPVVSAGDYRLAVEPPVTYIFPSVADDADLNGLPNGPFNLSDASRGQPFTQIAGVELAHDLPVDPIAADVFISKQASKDIAGVGDFVQYRILVQNPEGSGTVSDLVVSDRLPLGFRYQNGSARSNAEVSADPVISEDGRTLLFTHPELDTGSDLELRYVVEITAGSDLGRARNQVSVAGDGFEGSRTAFADVTVREDLLQSKAIIVGEVTGTTSAGETLGLAGVRVWMENGTYVVTDAQGKYHVEGVEPGTHVVQVDTETLPPGYELRAPVNGAFGASAKSRFVDVQAGTLWWADFALDQIDQPVDLFSAQLNSRRAGDEITYRYRLQSTPMEVTGVMATISLADGLLYVSGSSAIDGEPMSDPTGVDLGALTYRLDDVATPFDREISFRVQNKAVAGDVTSRALTLFNGPAGRSRTPVAINTLTAQVAPSQSEQARDTQIAQSTVASIEFAAPEPEARIAPYVLPEIDDGAPPAFDFAWMARQNSETELLWPPERHNPRLPAVPVIVKHQAGLRLDVLVDGVLVNPMTFEGTRMDRKRGVALSVWDNVSISETNSEIKVLIKNDDGEILQILTRNVHFGGAPIRAELVRDKSYLVSNGIDPPVLAVRFFDREGYPVRPGLSGEFGLEGDFTAYNKAKHLTSLEGTTHLGFQRYQVMKDGIAYIQLEPTTVSGEVILRFEFDRHRVETLRARLQAGVREWILVGLAEGSIGYNQLSGDQHTLDDAGYEDEMLTNGRVAFYSKGMVKGSWLVTAAYDTDKNTEDTLRQQIDPNRFYTLYGDGSDQRYDAESVRKLYLKVERTEFEAMFGDFDTGFDRTEFTRYERTMNGLKSSYYGEQVHASVFASETTQGFVRDEIRGDGTSGIYRLSSQYVLGNSERISITTRDRFHMEQVLERVTLTRYLDYTIDYAAGTLIFKQPIFSQDNQFNPVFIEAEYEVEQEGLATDVVAGVRVAYQLPGNDSEAALTYVNDGTQGQGGSLAGADLYWEFKPGLKVKVEAAQTSTDLHGTGSAYLVELERRDADLAGRMYARAQDADFGLGQQSAFATGTRQIGVDGEYRISDTLMLRAESFQQANLQDSAERNVLLSKVEYRLGQSLLTGGVQTIRETTSTGDSVQTDQLTLGATHGLFDNRVTLTANSELDLSSGGSRSVDYPSRAVFGAQYQLSGSLSFFVDQELTWGQDRDTQDTRFGFKSKPWSGADIHTSVQRDLTENGERVFATTGLAQQWRINDEWLADFGVDRVKTLSDDTVGGAPISPLPPTSGSFDDDFSAFFVGLGYRREQWDVTSRLEMHQGDQSDKTNLLLGASYQLAEGRVMSGSASILDEKNRDGGERKFSEGRWGIAWRPMHDEWVFLNRMDLTFDDFRDATFNTRARKLVNNFNANWQPDERSQLSLQFGFKYVIEQIDGDEYSGSTGLYGLEYRRGFMDKWDWSLNGALLYSHNNGQMRDSLGFSVGRTLFDNMWVSLGYNFTGFEDDDFVAADYTAQGPYLKMRLKIDQDGARRFLAKARSQLRRETASPGSEAFTR
ncbi:MAG: hypothetical protein O3A63_03560 [Proteobacteria bacterium]|nr:hypothetical protein [Pseudomonadota bacterium]